MYLIYIVIKLFQNYSIVNLISSRYILTSNSVSIQFQIYQVIDNPSQVIRG